jgi:hypothetical protein
MGRVVGPKDDERWEFQGFRHGREELRFLRRDPDQAAVIGERSFDRSGVSEGLFDARQMFFVHGP